MRGGLALRARVPAAGPDPARHHAGLGSRGRRPLDDQRAGGRGRQPDSVKTDGRRLYAVAGGALHAIDVRATPRRLGSLALPEGGAHELLLHGDRILVLTELGGFGIGGPEIREGPLWRPRTLLSEVDVSDPERLRVVRTLEVEGGYVSSRLSGATARVVIASVPGPEAVRPRATLTRAGRRQGRAPRGALPRGPPPGGVLRPRAGHRAHDRPRARPAGGRRRRRAGRCRHRLRVAPLAVRRHRTAGTRRSAPEIPIASTALRSGAAPAYAVAARDEKIRRLAAQPVGAVRARRPPARGEHRRRERRAT